MVSPPRGPDCVARGPSLRSTTRRSRRSPTSLASGGSPHIRWPPTMREILPPRFSSKLRTEAIRASWTLRDPHCELPQDPTVGIHRRLRPAGERLEVLSHQVRRADFGPCDDPQIFRSTLRHPTPEPFQLRVCRGPFARVGPLWLRFGAKLASETYFPYDFSGVTWR